MNNLELKNSEYDENFPNWKLIRDLIKGESALKQHDIQTIKKSRSETAISYLSSDKYTLNHQYLPRPDRGCDDQDDGRYFQYIQRASLFNAVKKTETGLAGMAFSKPEKLSLPESMQYLLDDADGSQVGLMQQVQEVLNDVLETGRDGLLVDFPERQSETTSKEQDELAVRSSIVVYKAESILDWSTIKVNAAMKLSFVKLLEETTERDPDDIFATICVKRYRVLMLTEEGFYIQRIYDEDGTYVEIMPKDKSGNFFTYIPFFFIGSVNNRPTVDPAPLIELAEVNLAHYRNSADAEESSFITGQPTLAISGLNKSWADTYFKDGISFGARAGLLLPEGGSATLVQAQANTIPENLMTRKEKQMIELGARLIVEGGGNQTAEAARIKHSGDASVMNVVIGNINQGYNDALKAVQQFQTGSSEEIEFQLNDNFLEGKLSAQDLLALVSTWQQGAISRDVLQKKLIEGDIISEDEDLELMNQVIDETRQVIDFGSM